jgi:hypothetical protein
MGGIRGWGREFSSSTRYLCMITLAARGLEELFFQLCCCVSFLVVAQNRLLCCCVSFLVVAGNRLIR